MAASASHRFAFTLDGRCVDHPADMTVTYVGRINRKLAEADARRRFEEWLQMPSALSRRFSSNQVVVR